MLPPIHRQQNNKEKNSLCGVNAEFIGDAKYIYIQKYVFANCINTFINEMNFSVLYVIESSLNVRLINIFHVGTIHIVVSADFKMLSKSEGLILIVRRFYVMRTLTAAQLLCLVAEPLCSLLKASHAA